MKLQSLFRIGFLFILASSTAISAASKKKAIEMEQLSEEDQQILAEGAIPPGKWIPGGIVGTAVGFGIGHAIQGDYGEIGWVFTATEVPFYAAFVTGYAMWLLRHENPVTGDRRRPSKASYALMLGGGIPYFGLRIWETVDVWTRPQDHNRRLKEIQSQMPQKASIDWTILPAVADLDGKAGYGLGLNVRF